MPLATNPIDTPSSQNRAAPETQPHGRGRLWPCAALTAALIAVQTGIDLLMGGEAEYFNAHATLTRLTQWMHGRPPHAPMIYGEAALGPLALPLATLVLIGGPLLVSLLIIRLVRFIASTRQPRIHGSVPR